MPSDYYLLDEEGRAVRTNPVDFAGMNEEYVKVFATQAPARAVTKFGVELPNVPSSTSCSCPCSAADRR
jgi:hypothetical protein